MLGQREKAKNESSREERAGKSSWKQGVPGTDLHSEESLEGEPAIWLEDVKEERVLRSTLAGWRGETLKSESQEC